VIPLRVGCPIRRSRDHRSLASPPGFSQRATSFIASQCQGIHQMPLLALDHRHSNSRRNFRAAAECRTKPPRTGAKPRWGKTPARKTASHEDTSPDRHRPCGPEPIRLGHITNSLFTLQTTSRPGSPRDGISRVLLRTSDGHRCTAPSLSALLAQPLRRGRNVVATVVEVNGIEPMTSCLQSRRSPN
jgi:hypothetical protein